MSAKRAARKKPEIKVVEETATMRGGETTRFLCNECSTEFDVTYEPKCRDHGTQNEIEPKTVEHCPFCGSDQLEFD